MTDNAEPTISVWECPEWASTFAELLAASRRGEDLDVPEVTLIVRCREAAEELPKPA